MYVCTYVCIYVLNDRYGSRMSTGELEPRTEALIRIAIYRTEGLPARQ